jgi:hypothetical protein
MTARSYEHKRFANIFLRAHRYPPSSLRRIG